MVKNETDNMLKVDLGSNSNWSTEFKSDAYGLSVKLIDADGKVHSFARFSPCDVAAIQEFLTKTLGQWDKDEI